LPLDCSSGTRISAPRIAELILVGGPGFIAPRLVIRTRLVRLRAQMAAQHLRRGTEVRLGRVVMRQASAIAQLFHIITRPELSNGKKST
jgi:hypothetical protein